MPDVQVPVRFRRETGVDAVVLARSEVVDDDLLDEVKGGRSESALWFSWLAVSDMVQIYPVRCGRTPLLVRFVPKCEQGTVSKVVHV